MICPYCKKEIPDSSIFCDSCGQEIKHNSESKQEADRFWEKENIEKQKEVQRVRQEQKEAERKKKNRGRAVIVSLIVLAAFAALIYYSVVIVPMNQYKEAQVLLQDGKYQEALSIYEELGNYKDSAKQIIKCKEGIAEQRYLEGVDKYENGKYQEALLIFDELGSYKDCQALKSDCNLKIVQALTPIYLWDFSSDLLERNGLHSTVHGNTEIKSVLNSNIKSAAYFDGDGDYIECGRGINLTTDFTFSILLCCQDVYKDYSAFFAKFEENGGPYAFSINQGRVNLWITEENGSHTEIESVTQIRNNEWYFICVVKEGDNFKLYIDGELDSEDIVSSVHSGEDLVTIGRQALMFYPEDQLQFTGYISNISMYDQTLSEDEILALCESTFAIPTDEDITVVADIPEGALNWNAHYYSVFDNCKSWDEAAEYCESRGGHLATITSAEENSAVFSYLKQIGYESAYFGLSDSINEGTWSWITGEDTDYLNWRSGEPNGESSTEDYAMFYYKFSDGTWNDGEFGSGTANGGTAFICEWD